MTTTALHSSSGPSMQARVLRSLLPTALLLVALTAVSADPAPPPVVQVPVEPADMQPDPNLNASALPEVNPTTPLGGEMTSDMWKRCQAWAAQNGRNPYDPSSYDSPSSSGSAPYWCKNMTTRNQEQAAAWKAKACTNGGCRGSSSPPSGPGPSPNPPHVPSNPNPANGATGITRWSPSLNWNGGDPDGGTLRYDFYFGTSNPPPFRCEVSPWAISCDTGTLAPGTVYYWQVKAKDDSHTTEGPVWSFTTSQMANTPSSPTPAVGATELAWSVALSWSGGDPDGQSVWYTVKGRYGSGGFGTVCSTSSTSCTWNTAGRGVLHEWYVEAWKSTSGTVTGPTWGFTTKANTPPTVCLSLVNAHLDVTAANTCTDADGDYVTYTFTWNDGSPSSSAGGTGWYNARTHHYQGTSYCPTGTASIGVSAWDGYHTSTGSGSLSISDWGHDPDADGLIYCREELQGTDDVSADTTQDKDGDSLNDYVESQWWPNRDTVFCLPGNTATNPGCAPNPLHKDLYVEMDYASPTTVNPERPPNHHLPAAAQLPLIVDFYQQAPVSNPAGGDGITLHLDTGSIYPAYDLGRGNDVGSHDGYLTTSCLTPFWQAYDDIRDVHFTPNGRTSYFHYALWLDRVCEGAGGMARGIPDRNLAVQGYSDEARRHHDFIHELGHLLGLDHGGPVGEPNYKPNYLSAMNYRDPLKADDTLFLGYSTRTLQSMSESSILETRGFGQSTPLSQAEKEYLNGFRLTFGCPDGLDSKKLLPSDSKTSVDFDCDESHEASPVVANVNGRTRATTTDPDGDKVGYDHHNTLDPSDDTYASNDCVPGYTTGCEDGLDGFTDWPAIIFTGLARSHGYGAWGGEATPDSFVYDLPLPREVCVPSLAGGLRCTQVI